MRFRLSSKVGVKHDTDPLEGEADRNLNVTGVYKIEVAFTAASGKHYNIEVEESCVWTSGTTIDARHQSSGNPDAHGISHSSLSFWSLGNVGGAPTWSPPDFDADRSNEPTVYSANNLSPSSLTYHDADTYDGDDGANASVNFNDKIAQVSVALNTNMDVSFDDEAGERYTDPIARASHSTTSR